MHELALTEKLFGLVMQEAEAHHTKKILKVKMIIGELSGIVEDSVELYFKLLSRNTIAESACLEFQRTETNLFCVHCDKEFVKRSRDFLCPVCGNLGRLTKSGYECFVESIEVE